MNFPNRPITFGLDPSDVDGETVDDDASPFSNNVLDKRVPLSLELGDELRRVFIEAEQGLGVDFLSDGEGFTLPERLGGVEHDPHDESRDEESESKRFQHLLQLVPSYLASKCFGVVLIHHVLLVGTA